MQLSRRQLLATIGATALGACTSAPFRMRPGGAAPADATEIAAQIRSGEMSSLEAVEAAISRAEAAQPVISFMVNDTYELARARAASPVDGPFSGVPYLIKDLNDVTGAPTRRGSAVTEGWPAATEQDAYVNATLGTGLVCIGKSATPENGYLPTTEPLAFGPTRNPWDIARSTGGSSGGAAAAVAAGVVPMAHANDGGGSIRFPSANCGLFGLKPSRGRLINDNPGARPLDIAVQGCISRSVRDTARLLAATEATGDAAVYAPVGVVNAPIDRQLKVGLITRGFVGNPASPEVMGEVQAAARLMESLGHAVEETAWPTSETFSDDFLAFWSLGAAYELGEAAARVGRAPDETMFEPFSLAMAGNATTMSPEDIEAVQGRLLAAAAAYESWIANYDVVMSPVFTSPPSPLGHLRGDVPFETLRGRLTSEVGYTLIHNVSGAPAMSVPLGWTADDLPVGVQFCTASGGEGLLLALAYQLEAAQPWADRRPDVWVG
ncbi:MAG: amidase [Maricaulaceae bacterium]